MGAMFQQPPFDRLAIGMIVFFIILCPLLFIWAKRAAASPDKNAFSRMAMISISLKMLLAVGLIVSYIEIVQPTSKYFVVPFFVIYFGYTLFETYFLMRIGKGNPPPQNPLP